MRSRVGMLPVIALLLLIALLFVVLEALGKARLWPAVLILILVELLEHAPKG